MLSYLAIYNANTSTPETLNKSIIVKAGDASNVKLVCLEPKPFPKFNWLPEDTTKPSIAPPFEFIYQGLFLVCRAYQEDLLTAEEYKSLCYCIIKYFYKPLQKLAFIASN